MDKIIHGDCLEVMKDIPDESVDMILCDLPYKETGNKWDNKLIDTKKLFSEYERIIKKDEICRENLVSPTSSYSSKKLYSPIKIGLYSLSQSYKRSFLQPFKNSEIKIFYGNLPLYLSSRAKRRIT